MSEKFTLADLEQAKQEYDKAQDQLVSLPEHSPKWQQYFNEREKKQDRFETIRKTLQGELGRRFDEKLDEGEIWNYSQVDEILDEAKKDAEKCQSIDDYKQFVKRWFGE